MVKEKRKKKEEVGVKEEKVLEVNSNNDIRCCTAKSIEETEKPEVGVYLGGFTNSGRNYNHAFVKLNQPIKKGQLITSDMIETPVSDLTESIAEYLWMKYDKTRLTDNWENETKQRQLRWLNDAEGLRDLVDEYYNE